MKTKCIDFARIPNTIYLAKLLIAGLFPNFPFLLIFEVADVFLKRQV